MKLLKFIFGIVLSQIATYSLIVLSPTALDLEGILRLALPLFFIALVIAFWFSSISDQHGKDRFASEKEQIRKKAEKDKERVIKEAQRSITVQSAKTNAKANFKVGAAFAGALGVGALFVFAQMVTAGLLALAATGGAMGGYYIRSKRAQRERLQALSSTGQMEIVSSKSSKSHLLKEKVEK